jgi:UDP-glucose 4-epimerase
MKDSEEFMILITGGVGYIGPQLVQQLKTDERFEGHKIVIFDSMRGRFDFFDDPDKSYEIFENIQEEFPETELVIGDVRYNTDSLHRLIEEADFVFHLAAVTGASNSDDEKKLYWESIYNGTANVLQGVKDTELEGFISLSSCNIYGRGSEEKLTEESELVPINTYAKAKAAAERLVVKEAKKHDIPATALRMSTNFGNQLPEYGGTRNNLVINKFVHLALHDKPLTPYGDGKNWRPFIHVSDSGRMIKEIMKADTPDGEVLNVGFDSMNHRVEDITNIVKRKVEEQKGKEVEVDYKREKETGPSYNVSFEKMSKYVDAEPEYNVEEGVDQLIKYFS